MSGTFLVQSGAAVGASPAVASKDGSSQSSDQSGGFASVLGQEDAAPTGGSQASPSGGGAAATKGSKVLAPGFDPARALLGTHGPLDDEAPADAKVASEAGTGKASPSDAPPVDLRGDDDRDRHALAAVLIPGFVAPPPMPPPAPHVDAGNLDLALGSPRGATRRAARSGLSAEDSAVAADADVAADGATASHRPRLPDAGDRSASTAGLAPWTQPGAPASSAGRGARFDARSAAPSIVGAAAAASPPVTDRFGGALARPLRPRFRRPLPPSPPRLRRRRAGTSAVPPLRLPRRELNRAGRAPRSVPREPRPRGPTADLRQRRGRPLGFSDRARRHGRTSRTRARCPSRARAAGRRAPPARRRGPPRTFRRRSAGRRLARRRRASRALPSGPRAREPRRMARPIAEPRRRRKNAQAADPGEPPRSRPVVAASQGNVDDGGAKTMTVVTKASPAADASPAATSERLRDALASVTNRAVLRAPATGHIDVPELGRIAVRAHSAGGSVDVDVTADHADARAILRGHVGGMTADLHQADVPVSRVNVERGTAAFGDSQGSTSDATPERAGKTLHAIRKRRSSATTNPRPPIRAP